MMGPVENYMPWYAGAAGGTGGALLGEHLSKARLQGKHRIPLLLAGTLLGTGVGVHGGEAVGEMLDKGVGRVKSAEEVAKEKETKPKEESKLKRVLKVMGGSAAGLALGYGAGAALGHGADWAHNAIKGRSIPPHYVAMVPPLIAAAGGFLYPIHKKLQEDALNDALRTKSNPARPGFSG